MATDASPAARAGVSAEATRPWRAYYALGVGVGAVLLALYAALPESSAHPQGAVYVGAYFSTMIGFYIAAGAMLARGAASDAAQLSGLPEARRASLARDMIYPGRAWLAAFAVVAAGIHLTMLALGGARPAAIAEPEVLFSRLGFQIVFGWVHIACIAAWWALLFTQAFAFRRAAHELPRVDLVDHTDLGPFVRVALRLALVVAVSAALTAALHVDWGEGTLAPQMIFVVPITLPILVGVFMLPLWGTHVRLREARSAELGRVHAALRGEPNALRDSLLLREDEALGTVELLAYREHVQSLGSWPVDASALTRLGLYLGIPLVGWVGGALVERLLDVLLD